MNTPSPKLLELLVCPATRQPLTYHKKTQELFSPAAGLVYPIKDGIPVLLVEEARKMTEKERTKK